MAVAVAAAQIQATVGAQNEDKGKQALAFLPNEIWIHAPGSVTWTFPTDEIHTVTFLMPSQSRPMFQTGCPGGTPPYGTTPDGSSKTDEAIAEFKAAEQISPREPEIHFGLGYLFWKSHRYDEAKGEFEAELSISPAHAQSLAYLGDIEVKRGHLENAAQMLEKSVHQKKDIRIAYLDLGEVRAQQKQYMAAIEAYERAEKLDPTQPDAHYRLGRMYQETGQTGRAKAEFAKTRELHEKSDAAVVLQLSRPHSAP